MSTLIFKLLLLAISIFLCLPAVASVSSFEQSIRRTWSTEDGLPQISVTDIAQDQLGFIWLTTEGGLVRFDGVNFVPFDSEKSPLLSNPLLRSVVVEPDNSVLFASTTKLIRLQNSEFSELKWQSQSIEGITDLALTPDNEVFIAADKLFILKNNIINLLDIFAGPAHSLLVYGNDVYIGGINQLFRYKNGQLLPVDVKWPVTSLTITEIAVYQQQLYLGTNKGLFLLHSDGSLTPPEFAPKLGQTEILKLYVDQLQNLWVSTYDALFRIHQSQIKETIQRSNSATTQWVVSAYEDNDGYLWLGSKSSGLTRLRQDSTRNYGVEEGLVDPFTWTILPINERLLVGHNQGLAEFIDGKFVHMDITGELKNKVIYTMFADSKNQLWLGTRNGLFIANLKENEVHLKHSFPQLAHTQINGIVEDKADTIWIASYDGLYRFSQKNLSLINESSGLTNRKIRFVYIDKTNRLWVGTEHGLFLRDNDKFVSVGDDLLKRSHITFIGESIDSKSLLVGTFQNGFATLANERIRWFSHEQGNPVKSVLFMAVVNNAYLISSSDGVYAFPADELAISSTFSPNVILLDKGASAKADSYRCCNGAGNAKGAVWQNKIWLPTLAGIVSVDADKLLSATRIPKPVFDGLYTNNRKYLDLVNKLPSNARDWRIDFTAPIFYRASSLIFRYQLKGYDANWHEVEGRRQAFYTNLPPGSYEFVVQSRYLGEKNWSQPLTILIELDAYWYESQWVKLLIFILFLGACYATYLLRMKHLANTKAKLEALVEARTQELALTNMKLSELNNKLEQASHTDTLTSLHNRRYLNKWLDIVNNQHTEKLPPLQIILIDLDNFKQINDQLGHLVGDKILVAMANLLKQEVRSTDHIVRWGGEEFLVIQENSLSSREFITRLTSKIESFAWPHQDEMKHPVRCSMGVVQHPAINDSTWNWDATLTLADKALYLVKTHGKAGWLQLTPNTNSPANLAELMVNYSEMELIQQNWLSLAGSEGVINSITKQFKPSDL